MSNGRDYAEQAQGNRRFLTEDCADENGFGRLEPKVRCVRSLEAEFHDNGDTEKAG